MILREVQQYREDLVKAVSHNELDYFTEKSILITGGTGLIGAAIVDLCLIGNEELGTNINVVLATRNEEKARKLFGDSSDLVCVDYDALIPIRFNKSVDFIIHCAGNASPELYVSNAVETMTMNFISLRNLLDYAIIHNTKSVLYLSSSEIYGVKNTVEPFSESNYGFIDLLQPRSSYASSKRAAETLCCSYASEYGLRTLIARPGHVYGPTASEKDNRVSSVFAYHAAQGKDIVLKSSGLQIRSYMYSLDCARAILKIIEHGKTGEAYNVSGKETTSIKDMATFLAAAGNVNVQYAEPTPEELAGFNPMGNSSLNPSKIEALGFNAAFKNEEGLKHTVEILKELRK